MKKGLLLLASLFMMVSTFGAMESTKMTEDVADFNPNFYQDEVIEFNERGIKFYVFLDGTFDFNTAPTAQVDYIKRGRRSGRHTAPRGIRIERDYYGKIRRIGNVFINYGRNDRIKRIGSVFIKYRNNRMKRVGDLNIHYSHHGVYFTGYVKEDYYNGSYYTHNPYYSYGWSSFNDWDMWDTWEYSYYDPFFDDDDFYYNYESFDEDDDFYYFKSKATKGKKAGKSKVIKRRKATKSKRGDKRKKVATRAEVAKRKEVKSTEAKRKERRKPVRH